jgi:hypothetical protein
MFARSKRINSMNVRIALILTCLICMRLFYAKEFSDSDSSNGLYNIRPPDESTKPSEKQPPRLVSGFSELVADYERKYSRSPPSNFDKWYQFAMAKNCSRDLRDYYQIDHDLKPFRDSKHPKRKTLSKNILDAGKQLPETDNFEIVDGVLYASRNTDKARVAENKRLAWLLKDIVPILPVDKKITLLVNSAHVPRTLPAENQLKSKADRFENLKLYKNLRDAFDESTCLRNISKSSVDMEKFYNSNFSYLVTSQLIPVFSSHKLSCFNDLLIPDLFNLREIKAVRKADDHEAEWDLKLDRMMIKSSANTFFNLTRISLDLGDKQVKTIECENYAKLNPELYKSKYLLVVNDVYDSFNTVLIKSRALVFFNDVSVRWFSCRVKPWIHYIPVMLEESDLKAKLKWSVVNDKKAREIANQGFHFARKKLTVNDMKCYMALLLLEYSDLIQ